MTFTTHGRFHSLPHIRKCVLRFPHLTTSSVTVLLFFYLQRPYLTSRHQFCLCLRPHSRLPQNDSNNGCRWLHSFPAWAFISAECLDHYVSAKYYYYKSKRGRVVTGSRLKTLYKVGISMAFSLLLLCIYGFSFMFWSFWSFGSGNHTDRTL